MAVTAETQNLNSYALPFIPIATLYIQYCSTWSLTLR
jgi:hypothetical protein